MLSGNVYYHKINTATTNGDVNGVPSTRSVYQPSATRRAALTAAGYSGFPTSGASASNTPFPYWRCIANALLADEPNENYTGLINRTRTDQQENFGLSGPAQPFGHVRWPQNLSASPAPPTTATCASSRAASTATSTPTAA